MIQFIDFRPEDPRHNRFDHHSDYWKLDPTTQEGLWSAWTELDLAQFPRKSTRNPKRLSYLHSRMQRGLISYEIFDAAQLKHLCEARKLSLPESVRPLRKNYRNLLENLDENGVTFGKFMELPAELRLQIYEHYIDFLRQKMAAHRLSKCRGAYEPVAAPPLAEISKPVRDDFLPIWARSFYFAVDMMMVLAFCPKGITGTCYRALPSPRVERFFKTGSLDYINLISRFSVSASFMVYGRRVYDRWVIDLCRGTVERHCDDATRNFGIQEREKHAAVIKTAENKVERLMMTFLMRLKDGPGGKMLDRDSLKALLRIFNAASRVALLPGEHIC